MKRIIIFIPLAAVFLVAALSGTAMAATYTVTNTSDSGPGSLRQAIIDANTNTGADRIEFAIPGSGPQVIQVLSALPWITEQVIIDGYTQPGATLATVTSPAVLMIVLNDLHETNVLHIATPAHDCIIRGLVIQGFGSAIGIAGQHNVVEGNYIVGNDGEGVFITGHYNTIGGSTPAQRNIISDNHNGVAIFPESTHNTIKGNYIGTDATGEVLLANIWDGIGIGGDNNVVGGVNPGDGNVVSGHSGNNGILIQSWDGVQIPEYNVIRGNKIGTNAAGTSSFPNGLGVNINSASNNSIIENLIVGNDFHGVLITRDVWAEVPTNNLVSRNSIHSNGNLGIDLGQNWVTPNDAGDVDTGPNNLLNYPELTSAMITPGRLIVKGTIDTQNPNNITLEFFANSAPDPTGYGEGEVFLGTAKPNANGKFTAALPPVPPGRFITATATDNDNNTSEFSAAIEAEAPKGLGKDFASAEDASIPLEFGLAQNAPNPFNLETTIRFRLPEDNHVTMQIFNLLGEEIRRLVDGYYDAGHHVVIWDGKDAYGHSVPSGVYLVKLCAGTFSQVKKMSLSR